jgi:hypothetical protein
MGASRGFMSHKRAFQLVVVMLICILATGLERPPAARGAVNIFASPIQAGCYLARHDRCRIHVDPFSIDIASGKKLVYFQLVAIRSSSGAQTMIWDFRPDVSNPVPFSGNLVTPSLPTQDFAAACGQTYSISLQGQDSGDSGAFNLGLTQPIHCPVATIYTYLSGIRK